MTLAVFFANSEHLGDISNKHCFTNPLVEVKNSINEPYVFDLSDNYGDGFDIESISKDCFLAESYYGINKFNDPWSMDKNCPLVNNGFAKQSVEEVDEYYDCINGDECVEDEEDFVNIADQDVQNFGDLEEDIEDYYDALHKLFDTWNVGGDKNLEEVKVPESKVEVEVENVNEDPKVENEDPKVDNEDPKVENEEAEDENIFFNSERAAVASVAAVAAALIGAEKAESSLHLALKKLESSLNFC